MNGIEANVIAKYGFSESNQKKNQNNNIEKICNPDNENDSKLDIASHPSNIQPKPIICQDLYWSSDGNSIVSISDNHVVTRYVIEQDKNGNSMLTLTDKLSRSGSIISSALIPNDNMCGILIGSKQLPIQLYSLDSDDTKVNNAANKPVPVYSYDTMNPQNEVYETPYSMSYESPNNFFVGSIRNSVSLFDINRREPIWNIRSDKIKCGGTKGAYKAIVSCFDESCGGINNQNYLRSKFFGTYKNEIYQFDTRVKRATMQLIQSSDSKGNGIYQLLKSENELYLYVVKRQCDHVMIYDSRHFGKPISKLNLGYKIKNQKMKGNMTSFNGLSIGNNNGEILNWERSLIESGGISRNCTGDNIDFATLSPTSVTNVRHNNHDSDLIEETRINLINQNPVYLDQTIVSYSPDKNFESHFTEDRSGICLIETP
ncbi:Swt21p [Maudiozyma exigua]|uniref:Protein SWT21 n=1 Tax=Maudiozyma exigua TaxID=34358 RepID=A0A9P7BA42_MAUEX|nr:Swt21p [Kazachstania exigua]